MAKSLDRLVVATNNPDKVVELTAVLGDRFELMQRPKDLPETVEDADTLEGNALKKALEVAAFTGFAALAATS